MSDELLQEMFEAGASVIGPVARKLYDEVEGEVETLSKLHALVVGGEPIATTERGIELLDRLTRPVLLDIAIAIVRAIQDQADSGGRFVATAESLRSLPLDRAALETRIG